METLFDRIQSYLNSRTAIKYLKIMTDTHPDFHPPVIPVWIYVSFPSTSKNSFLSYFPVDLEQKLKEEDQFETVRKLDLYLIHVFCLKLSFQWFSISNINSANDVKYRWKDTLYCCIAL